MHGLSKEIEKRIFDGRSIIWFDDQAAKVGDRLDGAIEGGHQYLLDEQRKDGHLAFELEADATIPSEYILLNHYLGDIDDAVEDKLAAYLRDIQEEHGGWPLFPGGDFDISATVKAYYALKLVGDDPGAPHMKSARESVLAAGGAAKSNVFTRFTLALFGQVPWRATPVIRVEAMFLPHWFPFHIDKVSYWSRTVMVPLFVLAALKPQARNPRGIGVRELFVTPPEHEEHYLGNPTGHWQGTLMLAADKVARMLEPLFPRFLERWAIDRAITFVTERLNGEDGLGGIFPAMANAVMAFDALGYASDHPDLDTARKAVDKLLVLEEDKGYCQPCLSPVWDTGLAVLAMMEAGAEVPEATVLNATNWLAERQILEVMGDWKSNRGNLRPGGWAFQYWNDHYPDVDDTAVVIMALHRAHGEAYREVIDRGAEWIVGMQSKNGGWGAFDADNGYYFLENIPFADHGALLDPPTADVTARCLSMLGQLGHGRDHPSVARGLDFLRRGQEEDGSWYGRWGTNYIYGTWSVICALKAVGEDMQAPYIRKAARWLKDRQLHDGGWGEDCASYWHHRKDEVKTSMPSQTAWALLGLMAAGEVDSESVARGIEFLIGSRLPEGTWRDKYFNAVGFPRIFYLRYHGYAAYFPLWALARYRNLIAGNAETITLGM